MMIMRSQLLQLFLLTTNCYVQTCGFSTSGTDLGRTGQQTSRPKLGVFPRATVSRLGASVSSSSPTSSSPLSFKEKLENYERDTIRQNIIIGLPISCAVLAYLTYEDVSHTLHVLIEAASHHTWESADGGKTVAEFLGPAINGPIIATVSILFATLVSTTVSTLHNRQDTIRSCISQEVEELRFLHQIVDGFPKSCRQDAREPLDQYTEDLLEGAIIMEGDLTFVFQSGSSLGDFVLAISDMMHQSENAQPSSSLANAPPSALLSQAMDCVTRINGQRAQRISAINDVFPPSHYLLLTALGASIGFSYLLETDVDALQFLADTQLRMLWSVIIGTLTALAVLCYDLASPFSGFYKIASQDGRHALRYLAYAKSYPMEEEEDVEDNS